MLRPCSPMQGREEASGTETGQQSAYPAAPGQHAPAELQQECHVPLESGQHPFSSLTTILRLSKSSATTPRMPSANMSTHVATCFAMIRACNDP
mmetsp:Transcript_50196/g.112890  ORF Transcript_50196/g.112890 Transcript_50196/m.112890 type:complete len:94 (-) Transcript_50196:5-286(-)